MPDDWLLVETLGAEPAVVAQGRRTKNLVPISVFLRRHPNLMAIQTAISESVKSGQALSSITPKHDRVIRTEVVRMSDGRIHGVHVWIGRPELEPPERVIPGPLKWDLTSGIATDTTESLINSGRDPAVQTTHGRAFAEDLPTRDLNPTEEKVLKVAIKPEPGRTFCTTWDITDHDGNPITVGFVARVMLESTDGGPDRLICRAMNWRSERDGSTPRPNGLGQRLLNAAAQPGVYRALVDMNTLTLLKWLDEPCPLYDWQAAENGERVAHPDDELKIASLVKEYDSGAASRVLRLRAADGDGWTPIHVTAQRVELEDATFAGLVSVRLPTADELASANDEPTSRRTVRKARKGSGKDKKDKATQS